MISMIMSVGAVLLPIHTCRQYITKCNTKTLSTVGLEVQRCNSSTNYADHHSSAH
jgi:hypothetical protein